MGSRADNRIGRALVGGVAQKVMGLAEIPVMVLNFQ
jgi:nucleotide-binding universal stress UspA family protein